MERMSVFLCRTKTRIRQGGVISSALFLVFMDYVLVKLKKFGPGFHIHNLCFNAFMYADDLLLLSISLSDLQNMINICNAEFDCLDMSIDADKSLCIRVSKRFDVKVSNVTIDDNPISWCSDLKYLGVVFVARRLFNCDLHSTKLKYFRSLNGLLEKMGPSSNIDYFLRLI